MASDGYYILANDPGTSYTDSPFTYTINQHGDVTGATYSFGWIFMCDGITTKETIASGLTSSTYRWAPTTVKFGPLMKKSTSGTLRVFVKTENGQVTEYFKDFTLKLKESIKPTISNVSIGLTNGFNNKSISNVTKHKLSFNVTGLYGADQYVTVSTGSSNYSKKVNAVSGATSTKVEFNIGSFDAGSSDVYVKGISISVYDSRGRSSTESTSIQIYKYSPPDVTASVTRNDNEVPTLTFTYSYQSSVAGATNTLKQFYARCVVGSTTNNTDLKGKTSPQTLVGTYDISKAYTFTIVIQDSVRPSAIIKKVTLPSSRPILDIGADGNTVTFFGTSPSSATKETLRIGEIASFGEEVVLGDTTKSHSIMNNSGLRIMSGDLEVCSIVVDPLDEDEVGLGGSGNSYFNFGSRKTGSYVGLGSIVAGLTCESSGDYSIAEGSDTTASGYASHAEGYITTASGNYSHAEGYNTTASGAYSHVEGSGTTASANYSHAEGNGTTASGIGSHSGGCHTIASGSYQTVIGQYNVADTRSAFIIGRGTSDTSRANAYEVDFYGNSYNAGDVSLDGDVLLVNGADLSFKDASGSYQKAVTHNSSDNVSLGYGCYNAGKGKTTIYGKDITNTITTSNGNKSWRPCYRPGDTVNISWSGSGFITNSSKDVLFTIPLAKPLIGVSAVSVSSVNGITARQNNKYLYGSASSSPAKPSSYSTTIAADGNFVRVTAKFANKTNVTYNNDSCGVFAEIKFTFS